MRALISILCLLSIACSAPGAMGAPTDAGTAPVVFEDGGAVLDDAAVPATDGGPDAASAAPASDEVCTIPGEVAVDDDADGSVDEGCSCESAGDTQVCCGGGSQTCGAGGAEFGGEWGPCEGVVLAAEICGNGVDEDCDGYDPPCGTLEDDCATFATTTVTETLRFPGNGGCAWGRDGNLPETGGHYAARIEHTRSLELPAGAEICDLDFEVPTTGMYFDDRFFFAFDDVILMSDHPEATLRSVFPEDAGAILWSWDHVRGDADLTNGLYCFGGGTCSLPGTEMGGSMSLTLPPDAVLALSERASTLGRYEFRVVATGDDNPRSLPAYDCRYSGFDLEVTVTYLTR